MERTLRSVDPNDKCVHTHFRELKLHEYCGIMCAGFTKKIFINLPISIPIKSIQLLLAWCPSLLLVSNGKDEKKIEVKMSTECFAICRVTELAVLVGTSKPSPLFEAWPADLCNGGGSAEEEGKIKSAARGGRYCCGIGKGCRCQHTVRHAWSRSRPCSMNDACSCWAVLLLQRRLERFHSFICFLTSPWPVELRCLFSGNLRMLHQLSQTNRRSGFEATFQGTKNSGLSGFRQPPFPNFRSLSPRSLWSWTRGKTRWTAVRSCLRMVLFAAVPWISQLQKSFCTLDSLDWHVLLLPSPPAK